MTDYWTGTLYVTPSGKGRPRFNSRSKRTYTPEKTANKEAEIRLWLNQLEAPKFDGPVELIVRAFMVKPKSAPKKRIYPTVKPDASNILKTVEDAANRILYDDDKQIIKATIEKYYDEQERIEIEVKAL